MNFAKLLLLTLLMCQIDEQIAVKRNAKNKFVCDYQKFEKCFDTFWRMPFNLVTKSAVKKMCR